ncbi:alpha-glucuronidase [Actinomyces sp. MRS3W]|uniref:alpha-glucuronidase n=1 Tax=Actinomyces sp. MRS3W TaxID=2800796 RepID=UPI0028FDBFAA|nr:alpha-glucuronidase [Actinomyces sp. MRS3W]MDU0347709.1 alpha-glucuronidase [Actinomyces sp. MRS3W]
MPSVMPFATSSPMWLEPSTKPWAGVYTPRLLGDDPLVAQAADDWRRLAAQAPAAAVNRELSITTVHDLAIPADTADTDDAVDPTTQADLNDAADLPDALAQAARVVVAQAPPGPEGYAIVRDAAGNVAVVGADGAGALYGTLRLLVVGPERLLGDEDAITSAPDLTLRMLDHWDNLVPHPVMGTIERGYAGDSVFFEAGGLAQDTARIDDYGLVLASLGINAVCLNNVNVHAMESTLLRERLDLVKTIASILRRHHVATFVAVNFAAPMTVGGLDTCDPLDERVAQWWRETTDGVYAAIPDLGGYVVKADSEGQPGPFAYGRDHADGANMLAAALAPHGGTVMWRCFVYNHRQDWRDRSLDRARAAYDHFMPLDGRFADNVLLQIKHGPLDFQVHEPVSPLLLGLKRTRVALELQIAQEYTGHQWDTYFLPTAWREVLDLDVADDGGTNFSDDLASRPGSAIVAVAGVGRDWNWTGNTFSQANLYGYGRLAWDLHASGRDIAAEWATASFAGDDALSEALTAILLTSREAYENYTSPLGVGFMVTPGDHYGPNIDGYEYSPWGTYHFADRDGVGVDRTPTGSGYTEQYPPALAARYRTVATCPERLMLFFHHLRYDHVLPESGVPLIQRIYDTHFEGVEQVRAMRQRWEAVRKQIPERIRADIDRRWQAQEHNAIEWRDQVCTYFLRHSGIPDAARRTIYP